MFVKPKRYIWRCVERWVQFLGVLSNFCPVFFPPLNASGIFFKICVCGLSICVFFFVKKVFLYRWGKRKKHKKNVQVGRVCRVRVGGRVSISYTPDMCVRSKATSTSTSTRRKKCSHTFNSKIWNDVDVDAAFERRRRRFRATSTSTPLLTFQRRRISVNFLKNPPCEFAEISEIGFFNFFHFLFAFWNMREKERRYHDFKFSARFFWPRLRQI